MVRGWRRTPWRWVEWDFFGRAAAGAGHPFLQQPRVFRARFKYFNLVLTYFSLMRKYSNLVLTYFSLILKYFSLILKYVRPDSLAFQPDSQVVQPDRLHTRFGLIDIAVRSSIQSVQPFQPVFHLKSLRLDDSDWSFFFTFRLASRKAGWTSPTLRLLVEFIRPRFNRPGMSQMPHLRCQFTRASNIAFIFAARFVEATLAALLLWLATSIQSLALPVDCSRIPPL